MVQGGHQKGTHSKTGRSRHPEDSEWKEDDRNLKAAISIYIIPPSVDRKREAVDRERKTECKKLST